MRYVSLAIDGLTLGAVYALIAIGFNLVYRTAGLLDFAQGDKVVVAALVALTLVDAGVPLWAVLLVILLIGIVVGIGYDAAVIRPTQRNCVTAAIIATVGASLILGAGSSIVWGANGRPFPALTPGGFHLGSLKIDYQSLWIWGFLIVVVGVLFFLMLRTRVGQGMVAAASDPLAATAVGINVSRARMTSFAIATALAGLAGVLIAPLTLAGGSIGGVLTIKGFTGAVIGGLDSTGGVVVGALLLGVVESVVGGLLPGGIRDPLAYALLLAVLLVLPTGLFGRRGVRVA